MILIKKTDYSCYTNTHMKLAIIMSFGDSA